MGITPEERGWMPGDTPTPMFVRAADRLYSECERAIRERQLDSRSPIGDATLDYYGERERMAARRRKGERTA